MSPRQWERAGTETRPPESNRRTSPTVQRAKPSRPAEVEGVRLASEVAGARNLLALQRAVGNQAVSRFTIGREPTSTVQRVLKPEDVASEMFGQRFTLTAPVTVGSRPVATNTTVVAVAWSNDATTVTVRAAGVPRTFAVEKTLLRPARTAVAGMDRYSAGVADQAGMVRRGEKSLAEWDSKRDEYKTPAAVAEFERERARREGILANRRALLNRKLIQETMMNRFDATIKDEVDKANRAHGFTGQRALDPNLLKAMFFEESQLGTAGRYLELVPSHPTTTRFNLGQVIDSSGMALFTLLESERPDVMAAYQLNDLRSDLSAAQSELAMLEKKASRTAAESARLVELRGAARQSWEYFMWNYRAPGSRRGLADAIVSLFAETAPPRNYDYGFWIHAAVVWLFAKHRPGRSWSETIKAYNGSGARAEHYRNSIVNRAASARAAAKAGDDFVPDRI